MSTQPHMTIGAVTFAGIVPPAPAPQPTLAEVLAAVLRLETKVDKLMQAQAAKPAARGYQTL